MIIFHGHHECGKQFFLKFVHPQILPFVPYANIEKPADFTMGDFWGIENFYPEFDDGKGCSAILARTKKAQNILIQIDGLIYKEVALDEITKKQANAFAPSKVPTQRAEFWEDYKQNGFDFCARKYFFIYT